MKTKIILMAVLMLAVKPTSAQWTNIWNNYDIYAACFANGPDTCFVTGNNGKIYRTVNGGSTWDSVQTIFIYSWFNDIYFPSPNTGYACGGTAFGPHQSIIAKTTDGGQTWDSLTSNAFGYEFTKIFCLNDSVAFFCGGWGNLVKTSDGGLTFPVVNTPANATVTATWFFNDTTGLITTSEYITSSKRILRIEMTTNGGLNWTTNYIDSTDNPAMPGTNRINEIYFRNATDGYAVADNGVYLKSTNGGISWTAQQLLTDSTWLNDIVISKTSGVGYISSRKYSTATGQLSRIYKTMDAGSTWQENFSDSLDGFYGLSMASDDTVYAAGYVNLFKTVNGGMSVHEQLPQPFSSVFPNPASGDVTILLNAQQAKESEISIYDTRGTLLKRIQVQQKTIITVGTLPNGVYYLTFADEKGKHQQIQKLVVIK